MLLNTLVNAVKRKSHRGNQSVTTDAITADIVACANEALRDVYKKVPKRYYWKQGTLATTAGAQGVPYFLPLDSTCQEPIIFWYTLAGTGNVIYRISKVMSDQEWFGRIWSASIAPNIPYFFRDVGLDGSGNRQIEIFPPFSASTAGVSINYEYYIKKPADLTVANLSAEIPVIPDLYHDVIEKGALYYFLKGFDDVNGLAMADKDYNSAKLAMDEADEQNQDGELALRWQKVKTELPGFRLM